MDKSGQKHYLKPVFPQWPPSESQAWPHVLATESHGVEASAYISNGIALASLRSRICSDAVYGDVYHPPTSRSYPAASSLSPQDALTPGQQKVWRDIDNILEKRHAEAELRKPKKKPQSANAQAERNPASTTSAKPQEKKPQPVKAQDQINPALTTSAKPQDKTPAEVLTEAVTERQETIAVEIAAEPGHKAAAQLAEETTEVSQTPERGEADEDIAPKAAPKSARRLRSQKRIATNKFYAQHDLKATQLVAPPQVDEDESSWGISGLFGLTSENSATQQPTQDDGGGWSLARNMGGLLFGGSGNTGAEDDNEAKEASGSSTMSAAKQAVANTGSAAKQAGTAVASKVANTTGRIFGRGKTAELGGEERAAPETAESF